MSYQGWANYETWAVNLWMGNKEPSCRHFQHMARQAEDVYELAEAIRKEFEEDMPKVAGVWEDLLNCAFCEVNWQQIAKSLLDANQPSE